MFATPITLFLFNRPDLTEIVFNAVAKMKPAKLFVVADGPRNAEDEPKCRETKAIIERVDWDCEVFTHYPDHNVGPKDNVPQGIDWVFSHVEESIFLEDDCLADASFFYFCQNLLEYYRDDARVMHINGGNFLYDQVPIQTSYYFSRYMFTGYGWASWRRAWKNYDLQMTSWEDFRQEGCIRQAFEDPYEQEYWERVLGMTFRGELISYDFPWFYTCLIEGGLAIVPQVNLVSNLGFRPDATHTKSAYERTYLAEMPRKELAELIHPKFVLRHREADSFTFEVYFGRNNLNEEKRSFLQEKADYYWAAVKWKLNKFRQGG